MKVLVTPKITLTPKVKSAYDYIVTLDKKNLDQLTIKRSSKRASDKRIIGLVTRTGIICLKPSHRGRFEQIIDQIALRPKIELTLDLIFGKSRDKQPVFDKRGNVEFKK